MDKAFWFNREEWYGVANKKYDSLTTFCEELNKRGIKAEIVSGEYMCIADFIITDYKPKYETMMRLTLENGCDFKEI
jgi:hypothetical protein